MGAGLAVANRPKDWTPHAQALKSAIVPLLNELIDAQRTLSEFEGEAEDWPHHIALGDWEKDVFQDMIKHGARIQILLELADRSGVELGELAWNAQFYTEP